MKLRAILFLLWLVRLFKFGVQYNECSVMTYVWGHAPDSGALDHFFESPNGAGESELYSICCVLRMDGFWFLAWQILAHSHLLTGHWREWEGTEPLGFNGEIEMECK